MYKYVPKNQNQIIIIQACWGPYGNEQAYKEYAECGFNWVYLDTDNGGLTKPSVCQLLNWAEKYKLKAIAMSFSEPFQEEGIDYHSFKCFHGVTFQDEPLFDMAEDLVAIAIDFERRYPGKIAFVNLAPNYWHPELYAQVRSDRAMLDEYVRIYSEKYLDKLKTKIYCMDKYPLLKSASGRDMLLADWPMHLELGALVCSSRKYDFHFYLQSAGGWDSDFGLYGGRSMPPQSIEDLRIQVNLCFAYGVKGFHYFTYRKVPEFHQPAIVDEDGLTPIYDYVKTVNEEIQAFAPIILSFNWIRTGAYKGECHSDYAERAFNLLTTNDKRFYRIHNIQCSHDLFVGELMDDCGVYGYMFVNYTATSEKKNNIVSFEADSDIIIYRNGKKEESPNSTNQTHILALAPGDGVFVIVVDRNAKCIELVKNNREE